MLTDVGILGLLAALAVIAYVALQLHAMLTVAGRSDRAPQPFLYHVPNTCTGIWLEDPAADVLSCTRCGVRVVATTENRRLAGVETDVTIRMEKLADQGAANLRAGAA